LRIETRKRVQTNEEESFICRGRDQFNLVVRECPSHQRTSEWAGRRWESNVRERGERE
jgi:hypothetical protein